MTSVRDRMLKLTVVLASVMSAALAGCGSAQVDGSTTAGVEGAADVPGTPGTPGAPTSPGEPSAPEMPCPDRCEVGARGVFEACRAG